MFKNIRNEMEIEIKVESNSFKWRYWNKGKRKRKTKNCRDSYLRSVESYPLYRGKWKTKKRPDLVTGLILGRGGEQWSK